MQASPMQAWRAVEEPRLILLVFVSIAAVVASVVTLICCCRGPTTKDRKSNRGKSSAEEQQATSSAAVVLVAPAEACEVEVPSRAFARQSDTIAGDAAKEPLVGNKDAVPADGIPKLLTPHAHGDVVAAVASHTDNLKDGKSEREEGAWDFSTIRNAGVNVKLALAAYETGQATGSGASADKPVLRAPRKRLDPALKDQAIIMPGRPNIQRHTVAAGMFPALEDHHEIRDDGQEDNLKQEAKKVLPDLLTVTPRRASGKSRLSQPNTGTGGDVRTPTGNERVSSGSRSSEAEKDYFGIVQRQDAVLRSVGKVKAPHKHKKGKVPTVDGYGWQASPSEVGLVEHLARSQPVPTGRNTVYLLSHVRALSEFARYLVKRSGSSDLDDFQRIRPHSSGDILS